MKRHLKELLRTASSGATTELARSAFPTLEHTQTTDLREGNVHFCEGRRAFGSGLCFLTARGPYFSLLYSVFSNSVLSAQLLSFVNCIMSLNNNNNNNDNNVRMLSQLCRFIGPLRGRSGVLHGTLDRHVFLRVSLFMSRACFYVLFYWVLCHMLSSLYISVYVQLLCQLFCVKHKTSLTGHAHISTETEPY